MIQFTKLRLHGFKSFVDRTELEIAPGLNGVVGPNGCGKSNLLEALRWVMGENSAKRMRGGGMEDVIFSGTSKRPARNIAEVSLLLDNTTRSAPAAWNNSDEIEVVRKIERDHGSTYKINGKTIRARDVQMLFADTVTGANSPAMVSQGRVAQIINAKPHDRRMILEESAGISGLYARRHEAELRLKAADRNLVRIEDILGGMESRLSGLKRQARQASRYRNIGAQIRQMEILIACMEWQALEERMNVTRETFNQAESVVADKLAVVTQLTKTQNTQMQDLPPLRQKEAEIAATLQSQKLALQRIEDEAARLDEMMTEAESQLTQTLTDEEHETKSLQENSANLERLESEQKDLIEKVESESGQHEEKREAKETLEQKVAELEERFTTLMQGEAEAKARRQSLEQQIEQNTGRIEKLIERRDSAQSELEALEKSDEGAGQMKALQKQVDDKEKEANTFTQTIESLQNALDTSRDQVRDKREALKESEAKLSELNAEIKMLESFLDNRNGESFQPVLDTVTPDTGFEKAVSRALGDALMASLEEDAPSRWIKRTNVKDMPSLPSGVSSLLPHVKAPKELELALSQIGFVEDDKGDDLVHALLPGQALVSGGGTYWRWDGFCMKAEASDSTAVHLEQKNKLKELEAGKPKVEKARDKAQNDLDSIIKKQEQQETELDQSRQGLRDLERGLVSLRADVSALREKQARFESETARLKDTVATAGDDIKTLEDVVKWDKDRLKSYEKELEGHPSDNVDQVREELSAARSAYQEAVRAFDLYQQEQNTNKARLHAIADERINLQNRTIRSRERLKQLEERKTSLQEKLASLKAQPKDFRTDKDALLSKISQIEANRQEAADRLAAYENEIAETAKALKEAESTLSDAREKRAHAQATLSGIKEQQDSLHEKILGKFEMEPHKLPEHAAIDMDKPLGDLEGLKTKKDKLIYDRDSIGPVNLRAEEEAQALEKEVTTLLHERNDLVDAISELRTGIQKINKEARERLVGAFDHVNAHFQALFTRLFAGGKAYLELIDSDDPLDAGLEIYAQPPGKALQALSLLSGGEQALTSIALIFGMFLTNPSPVCVLDEIDAPLDDANVERVCDLLDEIGERGETRFLIITHHRLTMARMDRLYGVTMAERGVSQLVSVDLQQSFSFLDEAA